MKTVIWPQVTLARHKPNILPYCKSLIQEGAVYVTEMRVYWAMFLQTYTTLEVDIVFDISICNTAIS